MDSGRGEHRSSADCQWQPLLSYLTALFHVDYLREYSIVRYDFVLLIRRLRRHLLRWRRLSLYLQIIKCGFLNCGLMQFSLMCEADRNQSAFSSGEGGSRRLTDEESRSMLYIIQCGFQMKKCLFFPQNEAVDFQDAALTERFALMHSIRSFFA